MHCVCFGMYINNLGVCSVRATLSKQLIRGISEARRIWTGGRFALLLFPLLGCFMFSVFLMMINIIHNRIWLTHIISVHSHRGAYTFHLHVSINVIILTRAVLEPFTSVQSWATILEICGTSLQYLCV